MLASYTYTMAQQATFRRLVAGIVLFSAAFGYVEASVVAYLRTIYSPLHKRFYPTVGRDDLFPLIVPDQLRGLGEEHITRLNTELGRELATLLMLAGAAILGGRNIREWVAIFFVCFGIWDITFYLWLKVLLGWPPSLMTWDILFLLPVPWVGPVIAPVIVAASMIAAGLFVLWREYDGDPVRIGRLHWIGMSFGWLLVFLAFIADFANTTRGGNPNAFHWGIFLVGQSVWCATFYAALNPRRRNNKRQTIIRAAPFRF